MNTYSANSGTCRTLWENSPFEKTTSWDQFDFFHSWTYLKGHVYKIMGVKGQLVACHSQSKSVMPEKTAGNPLKNSGVPNDRYIGSDAPTPSQTVAGEGLSLRGSPTKIVSRPNNNISPPWIFFQMRGFPFISYNSTRCNDPCGGEVGEFPNVHTECSLSPTGT